MRVILLLFPLLYSSSSSRSQGEEGVTFIETTFAHLYLQPIYCTFFYWEP